MKLLSVIFAICAWLLVGLVWVANGQTGSVGYIEADLTFPPPPNTNEVLSVGKPYYVIDGVTNYAKTYPFLLVVGVDTNGKSIMIEPPEWMFEAMQPDPRYVVKTMADLNGESVEIELRIRVSGDHGFFQGGLEVEGMGTEIILNGLNDKFIAQVPHTNSQPAVTIPESVIVNGAGEVEANGTYNKTAPLSGSAYTWEQTPGGTEWRIYQNPDGFWFIGQHIGGEWAAPWYIAPSSTNHDPSLQTWQLRTPPIGEPAPTISIP